jgi:hypothetical protein
MDEMVANIGWEYEIGSGEKGEPSKVQNFYRLLATADEKVHDGTDVIVLQAMTRLMMMNSKYNFSNQCYNNMVKLIIDLILTKHNMPKDLYQSKKIMAGLSMEYEKIDVCERLPYAKALLLPHNIDLMHQERNVAKNIISMCLDVTGFSKDNINARKDLAVLCDRPSLEVKKLQREI